MRHSLGQVESCPLCRGIAQQTPFDPPKVALKDDFLSGDSLITSAVAIANRICDPLQPAILQVTTRRHDNQTGLRPTQGNV